MSAIVTALGIAGLIAGLVVIVKALVWSTRVMSRVPADVEMKESGRVFAAIDNQRIDIRFGLILLVSGAVLAIPYFIGLEYERMTLTILGFIFFVLITAYSRYATQMRAPQPQRYTESLPAADELGSRLTARDLPS